MNEIGIAVLEGLKSEQEKLKKNNQWYKSYERRYQKVIEKIKQINFELWIAKHQKIDFPKERKRAWWIAWHFDRQKRMEKLHYFCEKVLPKMLMERIKNKIVKWDLDKLWEIYINLPPKTDRTLVKFPTPPGTTWEMVEIDLVSNDSIRISVGPIRRKYTYAEIGFKDRRKGDSPDELWKFLTKLAERDGRLSWKEGTAEPRCQKKIQELRKRLKSIMGINDDPFYPYKKNKAYQTKFTIEDKRYGMQ